MASGRLSLCQPVYQAADTMSMVPLVEFEVVEASSRAKNEEPVAWAAGTASKPKERKDSMSVVERSGRGLQQGGSRSRTRREWMKRVVGE